MDGEKASYLLRKRNGYFFEFESNKEDFKRKKVCVLWAKYSLEDRQDPEKRELFKAKLKEYIKISEESPERLQIWFWDECGFSLRVIKRKNWTKKGKRKQVSGLRRKGRFNVMGGLGLSDKKRRVDFLNKGNGDSFYQVLKDFYRELKYEWAGEEKDIKDFEEKGPKIVIILDNASIHKKKGMLDQIKAEMPNLVL